MNDRQFLWGLSNGVMVFAIAGAFWLGLGIGMAANEIGGLLCALGTIVQAGACIALLWAAVRLRRRAAFRASEMRTEGGRLSLEARRIMAGFRWAVGAQTALIASAVFACVRAGREDLIWPANSLVVSLHLIPLARIFHVRVYYVTAAAGAIVSIVSVAAFTGLRAIGVLAAGMSAVMWGSAVYLLWMADAIAAEAVAERWGV